MDDEMRKYIGNVLKELKWDLDRGKIIKFKTRKGLRMVRDGKRIEAIFIIRELT